MSKARDTVETLRTVLVDGDVTNANFTGADLEVGKGGTGASSAGAARTALGVAIGTDVLAPDGSAANLTNLPAGGNVVDFVASGTLPNGKPVVLKSDGTIEVVAGSGSPQSIPLGSKSFFGADSSTSKISIAFDPNNANKFILSSKYSTAGQIVVGTVSGSSISFGTVVEFRSGNISTTIVTFDPNTANKFLLVYQDSTNGTYGTCKVGTISGTTISLGAAVVFNSAYTTLDTRGAAFNPNVANQFVVVFRDEGDAGKGRQVVGTISGTSISFSNYFYWNSGACLYANISFDPNTSGKFVVTYKDSSNNENGTAIVGTFSGNTASYGTEVVFNPSPSDDTFVTADPNNANKYIITYLDQGNSNYGTAIIGTVSGTSISFGSEYVYNSAQVVSQIHAADPSNSGKFVVVYKDVGNSSLVAAREGTVSGTTISYGTEVVWNGSAGGDNLDIAFDPNTSGKFAIAYKDFGTSNNRGSVMLGKISTVVTNLTTTNFLGTSTASYTNGQTATIMLQGGVSTNQSSLAIGSTYYVQTDGTLATSAGNPSVEAGKAVSATTLLLKGI